MMKNLSLIYTAALIVVSSALFGQSGPFSKSGDNRWVDSVFSTLSPEEKIAQLIMVASYSNRDKTHEQEILKLIREQKVGGLVFFQGGPVRESRLINKYQAASKVPLLMAMDAEWGLGMRLDSTISYPYQMTLGAIRNDTLIYKMGVEVARQMKRAGLHMNFAPVADVNNNPNNPVINFRSFGEDKYNVARKVTAYMRGMQDQGILATAKHFPGHGDTDTDSHYALPRIAHSLERLNDIELYPFREMIKAGVGSIMVAHLDIPALDASGLPSTLSKPIVTGLLREELGFKGVIVTDAMNMRGVTASNPPGVVDAQAIVAGNDLLEFTEDVPRAIAEIRKAVREGKISQQEIDARCRKILTTKYWTGLHRNRFVEVGGIVDDLNTPQAKLLNRDLLQSAITVLNNDGEVLPVRDLDTLRIASVSFGRKRITPFQQSLSLYAPVDYFVVPDSASQDYIDSIAGRLKNYNRIIAGVHDGRGRPLNRITFARPVIDFISRLSSRPGVVVAVFKNPYALDKLNSIEDADALIVTYQDNADVEDLTAQLVFGGIGASGRLPVSIGSKFAYGDGVDVEGGIRFKYTLPEDAGMSSSVLFGGVDSIVHQALEMKAIPGCQVFVAKDRKVVLYKAYGYQDYADTITVKRSDLYDLASVTKISTSLAALMKLHDEGKFRTDATLGDYLPKFKRSNKSDIPMYDILTHQARFQPYIPFYRNIAKDNGKYRWGTVRHDSSARFPIRLKENMYLYRGYPDKMVKAIRKSPLLDEKKYVYSDFFFILAPRVVESMTDKRFEEYLQTNFYTPLGATSVMFNPLRKYPINAIVPTEDDYIFRHGPVHGTVHDEGASMMRGVSGHAGLFANANDLAKLMQMYLDMGMYGGRRYIKEETLRAWSRTQFPDLGNRRALGFDKPNLEYRGVNNNTAKDASAASFGHTGFTGTFAWMDPDSGLLYIFLSNRVNPTRENTRLYRLNTRTQIQQVLYDAIADDMP